MMLRCDDRGVPGCLRANDAVLCFCCHSQRRCSDNDPANDPVASYCCDSKTS